MIAVAAGLVAWEWARLSAPARVAAASATLAAPLAAAIGIAAWGQPLAALAVLVVAAPLVWLGWRRTAPWLAAGVVYLGLPCVALLWLRQTEGGGAPVVLWLFVAVCASDVGAYAAGRLIGGPKLVPRISPNKTWAGAAGGFVVATSAGAVLLAGQGLADWSLAALASAGVGVCAQAGDLLESWIKRRFGVKDTGSLIPGHGGLLDRVDSLMMASLGTTLFVILSGGFAPA
jgi:phosphatidate cytidylyltransferase